MFSTWVIDKPCNRVVLDSTVDAVVTFGIRAPDFKSPNRHISHSGMHNWKGKNATLKGLNRG